MERRIDSAANTLSPQDYARLPHPERHRARAQTYEAIATRVPDLSKVVEKLKSDKNSVDDAVLEVAHSPELAKMFAASSVSEFFAVQRSSLVPLKHVFSNGRLFVVGRRLAEVLFLTDVSDDIPSHLLRLPFRHCYLHFECGLDGCTVPSEEGPRKLVGVYVEENHGAVVSLSDRASDSRGTRNLLLTFVGEGMPEDPDNDVLHFLTLDIGVDERLLSDVLSKSFAAMSDWDTQLGSPIANAEYYAAHQRALSYTVRVLLYLNCASVRLDEQRPASELRAQVLRCGPGKKAKLERKLSKTYDFIEICAPQPRPATVTGLSGQKRAPHWQRGHIRNQAYGPQYRLHRLIFVPPMLKAANGPGAAPIRSYRATGS